ncbi:monocarboxylate transporter 12-B [Dunckerocampus dactyliophorus]|uniref:monocarboxylate transporter 12-B n=1 Tax=Dunckerocampus dactyliophorus TaxID=161453 RepID=UPI0024070079|nr:monocarboxylate transporter 12-B [Dunckerocampus dactyliophorus]
MAPPDGGWGWVVVGCCFMVTVCTRAVTRCVAVFFVEFQDHFVADYASTAWIHSLVDCSTMLFAPIGSLVANRWSSRVAVMLGGLLSSCGLLLSSFASCLEQLYFSMGVLAGLGFALCYTPAIGTVGCYFHRRKALAYGLAMSGSGIGTFVLAPAVQLLIELYTWRGALLVLSALVANLCVCGALLRPIATKRNEGAELHGEKAEGRRMLMRRPPDHLLLRPGVGNPKLAKEMEDNLLAVKAATQLKRRRFFSRHFPSVQGYVFLLLPEFAVLAASFVFLASGCSLPFVYMVPYALSVGVAHQHAAFLMSILGVLDIVGNITFGWLTDRKCLTTRRVSCYVFSVAMEGLCCLAVPLLRSFPLLVPFAALYGYFDGAYVALIPVVTSDAVGAAYLSSALGVVYFLHAIPYLVSPPIGGWLVDVTGNYTGTFLLSGAALLASALILATGTCVCRHKTAVDEDLNCEHARHQDSQQEVDLV